MVRKPTSIKRYMFFRVLVNIHSGPRIKPMHTLYNCMSSTAVISCVWLRALNLICSGARPWRMIRAPRRSASAWRCCPLNKPLDADSLVAKLPTHIPLHRYIHDLMSELPPDKPVNWYIHCLGDQLITHIPTSFNTHSINQPISATLASPFAHHI